MTQAPDPDVVSALKVQRDSAHKRMIRAETETRILRKHQKELLQWLDDEIHQWLTAKDTDEALRVANEIHQRAEKILEEAKRLGQ